MTTFIIVIISALALYGLFRLVRWGRQIGVM